MKASKGKMPVAGEVEKREPEAAAAKTRESIVDGVFDTVTAWAAQGLTVAKRGLEASARWLDGRAQRVGDLATRIGSPSRGGEPKNA